VAIEWQLRIDIGIANSPFATYLMYIEPHFFIDQSTHKSSFSNLHFQVNSYKPGLPTVLHLIFTFLNRSFLYLHSTPTQLMSGYTQYTHYQEVATDCHHNTKAAVTIHRNAHNKS